MAKRRPAGDGLVRKRSDGRWEGRIVVGHKEDGSPIFRSVFARTQKEVMRKLHNQIETYRDVELTEKSNMTLGEWLDKWLSDYMALTIRESTMDGYKIMTQHYIKPYLGDEKIGSVTTADIQKLYNWLREKGRVNEHYEKGNALSDSMIRSIHMMLHQAMDAAVRERIIVKNPTEGTVIPKNNYAPKQILTEEQLERFLEVVKQDPVWSDFFYTELTTGMRLGEICGLKWQDFEEKTGRLHIRRSVHRRKGGGVRVGETKTETGTRTILLPPSTVEILKARKKKSYRTQVGYEDRIYKHIIPEIGQIPLNKLTQNDLQQFYTRLKTSGRLILVKQHGPGLSDRMVRVCHASCSAALKRAVQEGLIRFNPAAGCKLPPKKSGEMQILTQEEMQRFLIQAKQDGYYELFLLELGTGLRLGEILALQWTDLNFTTGELRITKSATFIEKELVLTEPKTKSSIRSIILPPSLLKVLREYKKTVNSRWMFPSPVKEDAPIVPSYARRRMQQTLERAGCKKVRFHDLRHTFATMALEHGMDVKTLSTIIGHVSSATTLDIYSHVTDTMQKQAAVKIDHQIGKTDAPMPPEEKKQHTDQSGFQPYQPKRRKNGTGCVYQINDHLWEGKYSPRGADGKRIRRNVYAPTKEECEKKLAVMIEEVKKEITAEKEKAKV